MSILQPKFIRFLPGILVLCFLCAGSTAGKPRTKTFPVGLGWARNSVNTAVFRSNSLCTYGSTQYVAYYDETGRVILGKRKQGGKDWTLEPTECFGNVKDAHNVISIQTDGDGFLHMSWNHHGNKLHYARSIAPGSLVLETKSGMTGLNESNVTYPEFNLLPDGDLLFAYRDGSSGNGNLVLNRYDTKTKTWSRVQNILIDGEQQRNAYWQTCVDKLGRIHVFWVWRESWMVETNHDLCYARSDDGGITWKKSDGSPYALPITLKNAEVVCAVPQKSELINQTGITCDELGNPYIATYFRLSGSTIPQYHLIWSDGNKWRSEQVSRRKTSFTLAGGGTKKIPISRPRLVVSNRHGKVQVWYLFRDEERGSKVSLAFCPALGNAAWTESDLTSTSVGSWEPTLDVSLWARRHKLNLFVQKTGQGDGESLENIESQEVFVLEVR